MCILSLCPVYRKRKENRHKNLSKLAPYAITKGDFFCLPHFEFRTKSELSFSFLMWEYLKMEGKKKKIAPLHIGGG